MAQKVFMFSFLLLVSTLFLTASVVCMWGLLSVIRDSPLNGSLSENFRAFFSARRLHLRYKGPTTYSVFEDGKRRIYTKYHDRGGCRAYLYRGIVKVGELTYCSGDSVFYCPKCDVVVGLMSEPDYSEPEEEPKKGPLGIVR